MFYCNTVGSQTEIVFDGGSLIFDALGNIVKEFPYFTEAIDGLELEPLQNATNTLAVKPYVPVTELLFDHNIDRIHQAILLGIKDYFGKMGFKKAILGSSGGIDSAVVLALAVEALGKENVRAILMPSPYSSIQLMMPLLYLKTWITHTTSFASMTFTKASCKRCNHISRGCHSMLRKKTPNPVSAETC